MVHGSNSRPHWGVFAFHELGRTDLPVGLDARQHVPAGFTNRRAKNCSFRAVILSRTVLSRCLSSGSQHSSKRERWPQ
jgi:hypothetical protein